METPAFCQWAFSKLYHLHTSTHRQNSSFFLVGSHRQNSFKEDLIKSNLNFNQIEIKLKLLIFSALSESYKSINSLVQVARLLNSPNMPHKINVLIYNIFFFTKVKTAQKLKLLDDSISVYL